MQGSNPQPTKQNPGTNLVCGIDFSKFSKHVQFISLASGVLVIFIVYGYVQVIQMLFLKYILPNNLE